MMTNLVEVLITLPFEESLVSRLNSVSPRLRVTVHKARKPEDIPDEVWARAEVLYTNTVLPAPEKVPQLRWVQLHWAGADHAVDHPLLQKGSLAATNLSGANASQMAEFILMLLLALGHNLPTLNIHQQRGVWPANRWGQFQPHELRGSTVGIVGYGSIGRQVARLLISFGANVLATKRDVLHPEDQGYIPEGLGDAEGNFVHRLYPPQALRSMLKECDDVVITVPLTERTRGLIGAEELAVLPAGARLVDVSRGGVVDHAALIQALTSNRLSGAALDVYPEEPLPADSPLWKLPNVILTPHIAGFSPHYDERAIDLFAENLNRYLSNQPLYNRINLENGY
jgi:phosphoglycerate dehydrogenase-like enzyme